MLQSAQISKRQSEIRQQLSELAGKEGPTEEETRSMDELDREYRSNESRFRAALVAEDEERREADNKLETREGKEWDNLIANFEVRQAALHLDEGQALSGATAEVVEELRSKEGYRGIPIPFAALETRAGETVASGVPDPVSTRPIIDRLFPNSVAGQMGARMINIGSGQVEYPVTTSSVSAGWASSETGNVASATKYETTDRPLKPEHNLGVQMKLTRRTLKQSGGIEDAVRRDMRGAIGSKLDQAVFLGAGTSGQPLGVINGAGTYGITSTAVNATASWSAFRTAIVEFLKANAASGPSAVNTLIRPEIWDSLDGSVFDAGSGITEYDRLLDNVGSVVMSSNALDDPDSSSNTDVLLTTSAGGVSPIFVATWGAIDLIRDPYSDAASGGLRLTGLMTADVTISRAAQLHVLTGVQ
ncbi:phage major capsid protein [Wenzhouxiangella sp. EGI_FJ10305]|uniref:phage major capsid protein n=1 Tax=Wenzhouxiangella sp. EGI_FJ10305 TaxID=3243768 RepID=UPI0035E2E3DD